MVVLRRSPGALRPRHWQPDQHLNQPLTRQLHTSFEHLVKRQRVSVPLKAKREAELRCVSASATSTQALLVVTCCSFVYCCQVTLV